MRRTLALTALIIVAVLLWWQLERAREAPERAPARQEEAVPDDASRRPAGVAPEAPAPPQPEEPRLLLAGRVLHADGSPAVGAEVSTGWGGSAIGLSRRLYVWRTTTDADGRYRFVAKRNRTGLPGSLDVRARLGDRVAMPETVDEPEAPLAMPDLVLEDGLVVRVRVVNGARAPVAGAHGLLSVFRDGVTEHHRLAASSDGEGLLEFYPLRRSAEWSLRLDLKHERHARTRAWLDLAGQRAGRIEEVVMPLGVQVRGRVVGPDGQPTTGVWVVPATRKGETLDAQWHLQTFPDAGGSFALEGVPPGRGRLLLYAGLRRRAGPGSSERGLPWLSEPFTGTDGSVIDLGTIVLHAGGTIRGRVVDPGGAPLPNASAGLRGALRGILSPWVLTRADGSFVFEDVPPGEYTVQASQSRGEHGVFEGEVPAVRPDAAEVEVRLAVKPGIVLRFFSAEDRTKRVATDAVSFDCRPTPSETSGIGGFRSGSPVTWYRLDRAPGTWYVKVRVPGYEEVDFGRVVLRPDGDLVLDAYLRKSD
jgi:hypothetical protein